MTISRVSEDGGEFEKLFDDSGAFVHVCPRPYAEEYDLLLATGELTLRSVTGRRLIYVVDDRVEHEVLLRRRALHYRGYLKFA